MRGIEWAIGELEHLIEEMRSTGQPTGPEFAYAKRLQRIVDALSLPDPSTDRRLPAAD